jgi:hypothetical protein
MSKKRTKLASPSEVLLTTAKLLTPQEGQEIKSTVIKYQNIKTNSKLYDLRKEYLGELTAFLNARYKLQQAGYALQIALDGPLTKWRSDKITGEPIAPKLSRSKHWKFKLTNKVVIATTDTKGVRNSKITSADLYCWDTPDEDFTNKLRVYLPEEKADELELGFLDLGDDNKPPEPSKQEAEEPQSTAESTSEGTAKGTQKPSLAVLFHQNGYDEYKNLTSWPAKVEFYRNKVADSHKKDFLKGHSETERYNLRQHARNNEKEPIQKLIDEIDKKWSIEGSNHGSVF